MDSISYRCIPVRWGYAAILFILPIIACQNGETRFEDSPVIDRLLDSAPQFVVNTDIEPERWEATIQVGIPNDSLILGRPAHMIVIEDSLYISEEFGHNIFAVGAEGYISRKIGRLGKGPGEFTDLNGMQYSGSHVFVKEMERVQVFTETFEYVDSFSSLDFMMNTFSISPDYMFLQCPGNPLGAEDWIVCARSLSPPYNWIPSIKLLPHLDIPNQTGENGNTITVSPGGDRIALAYAGLPYIFIYDNQFRHLRTIRFEGKQVHDFQPSGFPAGVPAIEDAFTRGFIPVIKFINSRYLITRSPETDHYVFDLSEDDYRLERKIIFRPTNDTEDRRDITANDFLLYKNHLYISDPWEAYVYGYPFNLE